MSSLGFSNQSMNWFESWVDIKTKHYSIVKTDCGAPQRSISEPLVFLLYFHDTNQVVDCDLFLWADDYCLVNQHKNIK